MSWDVITSGYVSLDRIIKIRSPARIGFTSLISNADNSKTYFGGCSINIAWQLARLGLRTLPIVRMGFDYASSGFRDFLEQGGVCTDAIEIIENDMTSNCYLIEDPEGEHITLFYTGAQDSKYFHPIPEQFFENVRIGVLTVGSVLDNIDFFNKCLKHNVDIVFGMKADFDAFPLSFLHDALYQSTLIFTNQNERILIEQHLGLLSLSDLLDIGKAKIIITTLGAEGSYFQEKKNGSIISESIPAKKRFALVDTTGAGDAYIAGFIYGFLNGYDTNSCCKFGSIMSSFSIAKMGSCTGAPTKQELMHQFETGE